jgi:hypothetical protein
MEKEIKNPCAAAKAFWCAPSPPPTSRHNLKDIENTSYYRDYNNNIIRDLCNKIEVLNKTVQNLSSSIPALHNRISNLEIELRNSQKNNANNAPINNSKSNNKNKPIQCSPLTPNYNDYLCNSSTESLARVKSTSKMILLENKGDLLASQSEILVAHAVSADLKCSAGFALKVRQQYGIPNVCNKKPGDVVFHSASDKVILNVVTKYKADHKIRQNCDQFIVNFKAGIQGLGKFCKNNNIRHIAMPKMGSGIDQLDWNYVKFLLYSEFHDYDIVINVYSYVKPKQTKNNPSSPTIQPYNSTIVQSSSCPTPIPLNVLPCKLDVTPNDVFLCDNNISVCTPYIPKSRFGFSTPLKMVHTSLSTSLCTSPFITPPYIVNDPVSAFDLGSPITLDKSPPFSHSLSTTQSQ